ncbi:SUMF1/EgtB/PvdO family nonheme iron enzyme [Mesorhizobium sp.]|uniref:SUMF1/EgtB/PvdO family nonheme iron enzyme n=1 Tax=Mesorhizobium sp. TaxID=1871066 RepID=UPI001200173A|nr:SUMF1/EgtB/PvdO family nonheme iron enzyme [Mesorhizobium sp.]TIL34186.1 MAG: formylglycine-generating enzyme family protein [Mesorhizobium sp.]TIL52313.1 MAG: formylglycine-generating enzyme family protein [Mesorhizobium sp.]
MPVTMLEAAFGTVAALVVPALAVGLHAPLEHERSVPVAATVEIGERIVDFPAPGEFLSGGVPAAAPAKPIMVAGFRMMTRQVSLAEYDRCVAAGACMAADARPSQADVPVTGVNWTDADTYARWYSEATGESWRLPTALEAAAAAGERFGGESFSATADDPQNPTVRWIRRYKEEAAARRPADPEPKPGGHYGPNTLGIEDFGGNVWEWTSSCYSRVTLDAKSGQPETVVENCGVHVLEGRHRAYMSNFVRDGRSGGCAVGTPPENLGFRLVRDEPFCGPACWISALFSSESSQS